jgi:WD40 repeat protein
MDTKSEVKHFNPGGPINALAFSFDSGLLAIAGAGHTAHLLNLQSGGDISLRHDDIVFSVAFSPNGLLLATAALRDPVRIWDAATGKEQRRVFNVQAYSDDAVAFSPNGKLLAIASFSRDFGGLARVCSVKDGRELARFRLSTGASSVAFSPDSLLLAVGEQGSMARIWELVSGREVVRVIQGSSVHSIAFSANGQYLATAGEDGTVRLWDASSGAELARLPDLEVARDVAFSPDSLNVAAVGDNGSTRIWKTKSMNVVSEVGTGAVPNVGVFNSSGDTLIFDEPAPSGGLITLFRNGVTSPAFLVSDRVRSVSRSPDDKTIAAVTADNMIWLWHPAGHHQPYSFKYAGVNTMAFSPDSRALATAGYDHTVRLWNSETGGTIAVLSHPCEVFDIAFSPDGKMLASSGSDNKIRLWDVQKGVELAELTQAEHPFRLAFSLDSQRLAAGDDENKVLIWDLATRGVASSLEYSGDLVELLFGSSGQLLAATSEEAAVFVLNAAGEQEVIRIPLTSRPLAVAFHPKSGLLRLAVHSPRDNSLSILDEPLDGNRLSRRLCSQIKPPPDLTICGARP